MMSFEAPALLAQAEISGWILLAVVATVFVVPFVLGSLIARALRLRDMGFRVGIVLFALVLGLAPFAWQSIVGAMERSAYEQDYEEWKRHQRSEAENAEIHEALDELKKAKPELRIER